MDAGRPDVEDGQVRRRRRRDSVYLLDPPDVVRRKVARAVTDSDTGPDAVRADRRPSRVSPTCSRSWRPAAASADGITTYGALKAAVTDAVVAELEPIAEAATPSWPPTRRTSPAVYDAGAARCREVTAPVLAAAERRDRAAMLERRAAGVALGEHLQREQLLAHHDQVAPARAGRGSRGHHPGRPSRPAGRRIRRARAAAGSAAYGDQRRPNSRAASSDVSAVHWCRASNVASRSTAIGWPTVEPSAPGVRCAWLRRPRLSIRVVGVRRHGELAAATAGRTAGARRDRRRQRAIGRRPGVGEVGAACHGGRRPPGHAPRAGQHALGELARPVAGGLHGGEERRPHLVDLELAQRRGGGAARRGDLLAQHVGVGRRSRAASWPSRPRSGRRARWRWRAAGRGGRRPRSSTRRRRRCRPARSRRSR